MLINNNISKYKFIGKAAGNDKRLLKQLESKFNIPISSNPTDNTDFDANTNINTNTTIYNTNTNFTSSGESEEIDMDIDINTVTTRTQSARKIRNSNTKILKLPPTPTKSSAFITVGSPSQHVINLASGIKVKTFYYLISTMNNMFPDYDFSQIPSEVFIRTTSLPTLINHFNTSIFNTGIDRNTTTFADFTRRMWNCMSEAVGSLEDSEIFSFDSESFEIDDPFRERGTM